MFISSFKKVANVFYILIISLNLQAQSTIESKNEFENARMVFHRVYFEKAFVLFENLIKKQPDHALSYAYLAMIDYMLFKDPKDNIKKARFLNIKEHKDYQFTNALCFFASNDLSMCEQSIKKYLSKNPNNPFAMHILGFTQIDLGRAEDGLETLLKLINSNPGYFPAYNHMGYAYLNLSRNSEALKTFNLFLKSDSLNPSALDSYADGLYSLGQYDNAIAQLIRAMLIEPNFAYGWKHMGDIFNHLGENDIAINAYENAKKSAQYYGSNFKSLLNKKINSLKK